MCLIECDKLTSSEVIKSAINVHTVLGPGLLESVYEAAMLIELKHNGLSVRNQISISSTYRSQDLGIAFIADIIVEDKLVLELKSVDSIKRIHQKQLATYLKLLNIKRGLILNFNSSLMTDGIRQVSI